jgi:hypothetical protein
MQNQIISYVEDFAKTVSQLGYDIRTENENTLSKTVDCVKSIINLDTKLDELSKKNCILYATSRINLMEIASFIKSAFEADDYVTMADILEYELLNELEELLSKLEEQI